MSAKAKLKFEEAMQQLEEIVTNLERGDVPLEEALEQFQKGVGLSKICTETLQNAEETLTKMDDEKGNEAPFENPSENE